MKTAAQYQVAHERFTQFVTDHTHGNPTIATIVEEIQTDFSAGKLFAGINLNPALPGLAEGLRLMADGLDYAWGTDETTVAQGDGARG